MSEQQQKTATTKRNRSSARFMFILVLGMFGFGFAMVPLYNLLCEVTGINGSTTGRVKDESILTARVDYNRVITVQFDSTMNMDLPWEIRPMVKKVEVHPGEIKEVKYYAKNNANHAIVAQAIPGISPWQATNHFNKTECFCFAQQKLEAGEAMEMVLRFVIDPALPDQYKTITLSYTFMDTDRSKLKNNGQYSQTHKNEDRDTPFNKITFLTRGNNDNR